jgi:hypothetical protein
LNAGGFILVRAERSLCPVRAGALLIDYMIEVFFDTSSARGREAQTSTSRTRLCLTGARDSIMLSRALRLTDLVSTDPRSTYRSLPVCLVGEPRERSRPSFWGRLRPFSCLVANVGLEWLRPLFLFGWRIEIGNGWQFSLVSGSHMS